MDHVKYECIVSLRLWSQDTSLAKSIIIIKFLRCTPGCREWRISYYRIKLFLRESIIFKSISILYVKVTKLNSMKQHVHSGKVECRRVLLLTINQISLTIASSTEKQ